MKKNTACFAFLALMVSAASPALAGAVDTTKVYHSGFLVLAFLGFCAMIVVAQLLPALILMVGSIRNMVKGTAAKKAKANLGL